MSVVAFVGVWLFSLLAFAEEVARIAAPPTAAPFAKDTDSLFFVATRLSSLLSWSDSALVCCVFACLNDGINIVTAIVAATALAPAIIHNGIRNLERG